MFSAMLSQPTLDFDLCVRSRPGCLASGTAYSKSLTWHLLELYLHCSCRHVCAIDILDFLNP